MIRKLIWVTLMVTIVFFGARVYYRLTDDFRIVNMVHEMPHHPEWEMPPLNPAQRNHLKEMFRQPYSYVGKGAQSYVFASEDKKYVIKFFKFKHLKPHWLTAALPDLPYIKEYKERKSAKKKRLINSVFSGYKLAYDVHKGETGIVYLHLNKTQGLNETVTLIDKIGRTHLLELDPIVFVIQEHAQTTRMVMTEALERGDLALAKKRMNQIFDLYLLEYGKGIYDRDHGVMHNTGFVGENPIHLDVGKLSKEPEMQKLEVFRPDLEKIGYKYEMWLKSEFPEFYPELAEFIETRFSEIFGERFEFVRS